MWGFGKDNKSEDVKTPIVDTIQEKSTDAATDTTKQYYEVTEHYYTQIYHKEEKKFTKDDLKKLIGKLFNKSKEDSPKQVLLFRNLTEDEFKKVANLFYYRKFEAGEYLFHEGNPGSALFYIRSGEVVIQKTVTDSHSGKHDVKIQTLEEGNIFGEMSLLDDASRSTDAVCSKDSEILMLFRAEMQGLFLRIPKIGLKIITNLASILSGRLRGTNNNLIELRNKNKELEEEKEALELKIKELEQKLQEDAFAEKKKK